MTTEQIQEEIERTRGEMADTLNAIERKLSPRQIMDQAVDTMREFASDRSRVANVVRDNPIPLALIGLGVGWLAISGMGGRRASASEGSYESMEGLGYGADNPNLGTAGSAEYGVAAGTSGGSGMAGEAREQAARLADQARETMAQASSRTRQKVDEWTRGTRRTVSRAADTTWESYTQHPFSMGVVAVLVGAAVGAVLPRSRAETQALGSTADQVMRQARAAGSELMDKAAQVAETATRAASDEAKRTFRQEPSTTGPASTMTH